MNRISLCSDTELLPKVVRSGRDRRGTSGAPHPGGKHESSAWPTIENNRRHSPCRGRLKERRVSSVPMKTFHAILCVGKSISGSSPVDGFACPIVATSKT